jgi:hypothetical protein
MVQLLDFWLSLSTHAPVLHFLPLKPIACLSTLHTRTGMLASALNTLICFYEKEYKSFRWHFKRGPMMKQLETATESTVL